MGLGGAGDRVEFASLQLRLGAHQMFNLGQFQQIAQFGGVQNVGGGQDNFGADLFIETCFNYPTLGELYKYATYDALGKRARAPKDPELPVEPAAPPATPQAAGHRPD